MRAAKNSPQFTSPRPDSFDSCQPKAMMPTSRDKTVWAAMLSLQDRIIAHAVSSAADALNNSPFSIRAITSATTSARTSGVAAASFFAADRFAALRILPDDFPCMTFPEFLISNGTSSFA